MKPIIAVVTGTGAQGRSVSRAFHNSGIWRVRVLTRNPDGDVAQEMKKEGMEIVQANFEDRVSLVNAFTGSWAVYSVTIPPWHQSYTNKMEEYDQGVLQANAAKEANIQLLLFSTLPYVGADFMGLGGVELYDAKARTNDYITSISLPAVYLSTSVFVDIIHSWPTLMKTSSKIEFWDYVVEKEKQVVFLWVERDLGKSVLSIAESFRLSGKPLLEHPYNHTIQPLGSWRGTWGEIAREIEKQTGIETEHTVIADADERWNYELTKAFIYQNNHGLYPTVEFPPRTFIDLGVKFGTLEEFIRAKVVPMLRQS
ncbi:hypothetical protein BDQ12DRAFT_692367 [Crucibulum laeve]|uniref:NmrA-like domain-containing protein n=1 Tax=Crucibulum laeve TaxID=68775 RepID=A0A5C3LHJ5_9AGAR|nr:hypothetical protein BDQ12DRAFT_692367 [Crucibulum laeve]